MVIFHRLRLSSLLCFCLAGTAWAAPPVQVSETSDHVTMDNGIIAISFSKKSAFVESITYRRAGETNPIQIGSTTRHDIYLDMDLVAYDNNGKVVPNLTKGDYVTPGSLPHSVRVVNNGPEVGDLAVVAEPSPLFPFEIEFHYVMPRGEHGIYLYSTFRHKADMPAADFAQTRFVVRGMEDASLFTNHIVDDVRKGPYPLSKQIETIQDATYRLADGSSYTKYNTSQFGYDFTAQGMAGHGLGLWFVWPSIEFCNGGPLRQDLTVQMDNLMQSMFQSTHYGNGEIRVEKGEVWSKFFGPVLLYVNEAPTIDALWNDAQARVAAERAKWPYTWVRDPDYVLERGSVRGRIHLTDGEPTQGAWVVLSPKIDAGKDWTEQSKGYIFWTKVGSDGGFAIDKVRPGLYTLFVSGADQFVDFQRADVAIHAGTQTDLGELLWTPVTHGKRLWQIGVADRGGTEFRDGKEVEYRNYDVFRNYFTAFPNDVNFVIGKSNERRDWNFAMWSWYNQKPFWTVQFNNDATYTGNATLTLGIAGSDAGDLLVGLNGTQVAKLKLPRSGTASHRSGGQDSNYLVDYVTFDAAMLRQGENNLTFGLSGATPLHPDWLAKHERPRSVMFDAIRLEAR